MMKQPAGNTNATYDEAVDAIRRAAPLPRDPDHDEIAEVARDLYEARGGRGGSPEADWFEACEVVRKRRAATTVVSPEGGNSPAEHESYLAGAGIPDTNPDLMWKERNYMENADTGTMDRPGMMDNVRNQMSNVSERVNNMMDPEPKSMPRPEHREGVLARTIEQQTAKIPSDAWLWAAVGSMGLSLALELSGKEKTANFVGHWVPTLLIFGLYNKMVKLQGSDGL
jgi:hypothetical protein